MKKVFLLLALIMLSLSVVSAYHDTHYDSRHNHKVIVLNDYDRHHDRGYYSNYFYDSYYNRDRYPVSDYRNGYTYRTSSKFKHDYERKVYLNYRPHHDSHYRGHHRHYRDSYRARDYYYASHDSYYDKERRAYEDYYNERYNARYRDYYFKKNPYRGGYDKVECYTGEPRGTLLYRKCP